MITSSAGLLSAVLIISILLQIVSAVYALLLIKQSGFLRPWLFVSASISLMAVRRVISFCQMVRNGYFPASSLEPELVALLISILMISGLLFLGPAFRMIRRQKEQETKERDFLIRESHHNVKNNLQMLKGLISLQGLSEKSPAVKDTLKELELRIGSFLLLHEQVYGSSKNDLSFRRYVHALSSSVAAAYSHRGVKLVLDIEDLYVSGKDLMSCGVIINEALTNAYKYAFTGTEEPKILITVRTEDAKVRLTVQDNGSGFSVKEKSARQSSFGLALMQALGQNAGWQLSIDGSDGTRVDVSFPVGPVG